jgi:uncharacterized protein YbjT (DUF2867 family)
LTSVLLAGATGLVGGECLRLLAADPAIPRVVTIARRPLEDGLRTAIDLSRVEEHLVDFDRLSEHAPLFAVDAVVCALGTTMKQAGSRDRFRRVDFQYPLEMARLGLTGGAGHFLLVSAIGADPRSRIFYNRVKGEVEEAISSLPYRSTTVLRPSLLLGDRREFRLGEAIGNRLGFLLPSKLRPVPARDVAAALALSLLRPPEGFHVAESGRLPGLADEYRRLRRP